MTHAEPGSALAAARAAFSRLQADAARCGVALRSPPPEPTSCCGRGCNGCVWEGFYAAAQWWREDAETALAQAAGAAAEQLSGIPPSSGPGR